MAWLRSSPRQVPDCVSTLPGPSALGPAPSGSLRTERVVGSDCAIEPVRTVAFASGPARKENPDGWWRLPGVERFANGHRWWPVIQSRHLIGGKDEARRITARMTPLRPGQSPPPPSLSRPIRIAARVSLLHRGCQASSVSPTPSGASRRYFSLTRRVGPELRHWEPRRAAPRCESGRPIVAKSP